MRSEEFLLGFEDGFRLSCFPSKTYDNLTQAMDYGDGRRLGREFNQKCRNFSRTETLPGNVAMWETVYLALTKFFDDGE